jgi:hypothetical protein
MMYGTTVLGANGFEGGSGEWGVGSGDGRAPGHSPAPSGGGLGWGCALTSPPSPRSSPLAGEERGSGDGRARYWFPVTAIPVPLLTSPRWGYALPTTGVNHGCISGYDCRVCCFGQDSAQLQPCYHVLDELPYAPIMRVSQGLECGSHAAAPAVLAIRRVVHRSPFWSRGCWTCSFRSSSRSEKNELPARRRVVAPGSCLYTNGYGQHLTVVARMHPHRLEACTTESLRHGERLQSGLTQRDMWVMHSAARERGER